MFKKLFGGVANLFGKALGALGGTPKPPKQPEPKPQPVKPPEVVAPEQPMQAQPRQPEKVFKPESVEVRPPTPTEGEFYHNYSTNQDEKVRVMDMSSFDRKDIRKGYSTLQGVINYAVDIPVFWFIVQNKRTKKYHTVVEGSEPFPEKGEENERQPILPLLPRVPIAPNRAPMPKRTGVKVRKPTRQKRVKR